MSEDVKPFEEYKEMIKDMRKEEMIKGLYDLSARVTKQENIIKEAKELVNKSLNINSDYVDYEYGVELLRQELLEILDKGE